MLREIELIILVGAIYIVYIDRWLEILQSHGKLCEEAKQMMVEL